ncbi:Uu.00g073990.m01.CDS01 [Anthostomella pinea]|uniref:Uu.00g073990.m01.CDS01 n=1 Tax=Anthostomella pinea TaxID=933095 RepID=A0AAI8VW46_9PEZI|nr:Uu.00g073990.m01.CDS01 [Anthostomella pinea]
MACFSNLLVLLAFWLSLLAPATSTPLLSKADVGKTSSMQFAHNADNPRHGPSEHLRTLKKFNIPIPERLQQVVDEHNAKLAASNKAATDGGGVPTVSNSGDLMWLSPVGVGTPPQQLYVDMDTGSSDSWVFSTDTAKSGVAGQTLWDPSKSSTVVPIKNCTWSILYGDFSNSEGICYQDTFSLGELAIPGMTIESATKVSKMFTESKAMSGLVGLGWSSIKQTEPPQKSLLEFLPDVLANPLFTVDFQHNSTGTMNFGYIDHNLHTSDIDYIGVDNSDGFWAVNSTGFAVGGVPLAYTFQTPKTVILDTGSTLFFAPDAAVDTYFDAIPGANFSYEQYGYVVPCHAQLPDFIWEIGDATGKKVTGHVPGAYIPYQTVSDELCYAGIQSLDTFTGLQGIFGDIFLKSGFFVFDIAGQKLGVATKTLNTSNSKRDLRSELGANMKVVELD